MTPSSKNTVKIFILIFIVGIAFYQMGNLQYQEKCAESMCRVCGEHVHRVQGLSAECAESVHVASAERVLSVF